MPMDIDGVKWACEPCVRGHRATKCDHFNRWMVRVKKPGRPLQNCPHATGECSCKDDKVIMRKIAEVKTKGGNCDCTRVRSFDPAFDDENFQSSPRPVRIQDPVDPKRTIPYMSRRLLQQAPDDSNEHLLENQQHATPNGAPTETANDQPVPAGPYHRLPSSDAILSQRPPSPLNRFANGGLVQAGAAIYSPLTQNSQSPHQEQPHPLVQAQSPTAGQGYRQFPGVGPNSSVYSNLGSLPQQLNTGNHVPQLGSVLSQLVRNGNQPLFVNPRTGATYDTDPRYPMTLAEKQYFEGEGYTYPEPINPFPFDINSLDETDFQWPSNPNAPQSGYGGVLVIGTFGGTPMYGTNGATPMNGTNGATPMYGTNGATPMNGTNGGTPMNGTNGAAPMNGTNGAAPMNGTNGAAPMNGTNGATPMNGTNGATPVNGTWPPNPNALPQSGYGGILVNGTNGRFPVNGTRPSAGLNALSDSSDCQCGPGCNCVYCVAHPYNPATRARVQELSQIIERDFQRPPNLNALPQSGYGGIPVNDDPSDQPPNHTMRSSDYYTLAYPMEHSRNRSCTGVSATCPCGSDCTCVGCLTHAGQH